MLSCLTRVVTWKVLLRISCYLTRVITYHVLMSDTCFYVSRVVT
jgi:hypothetical protein